MRILPLAIAFAILAPCAAASAPSVALSVSADRATARVGDSILVTVTARDANGAPLEGVPIELGARAELTSSQGIALFPVANASAGTMRVVARASGATDAPLDLAWVAPRIAVDSPSSAFVGDLVIPRALVVWGENLTPVVGLDLGIARDGALLGSARTDALGAVALDLHGQGAGVASYQLVADDPLFAGVDAAFAIVWSQHPTPNVTVEPIAPAVASSAPAPKEDHAPVLGGVSIAIQGAQATAIIDGVSDPDGDPVFVAYTWEIAGARASAPNVAVRPGDHVALTIVAADGRGMSTVAHAEAIAPPDAPPIARAEARGERIAGSPLTFDASSSSDPEGASLAYAWTFSDGATSAGAIAQHAFAAAGPASARVVVTDPSGNRATADLDLAILAPPDASAPANGTYGAPPDASVDRVLVSNDATILLVDTPTGPQIYHPDTKQREDVRPAPASVIDISYRPRAAASSVEVVGAAEGWTLARVRDPQPGLPLLGARTSDGRALSWWRDAGDIVVLTREATFVIDHALAPLALDASATPMASAYAIRASVTGGAPLASLRIVGPRGVVLNVTEPSTEARVAPGTENETYTIVADTLAGEHAERVVIVPGIPVDLTVQPAGGQAVGAQRGAPGPSAPLVAVAMGLLALALAQRRRA